MIGNNGIKDNRYLPAPLHHSFKHYIYSFTAFYTMKKYLLLALALVALLPHISAQKADKKADVYATSNGAIKGYDPVAYFLQNNPVEGSKEITHTWNNAVWHFSSTMNRDSFVANPEKFAPQFGGWCAYGWAQGYPAKINPDAWSIVDGKLYLNYNKDVQQLWDKKQAEYITKATENYKAREK